MSFIEDLPKKKIQDFFADGDPEKTKKNTAATRKERIPAAKQNKQKVVTYLDEETYRYFKRYCEERDMKPSLVVRHLIKDCLNKPL